MSGEELARLQELIDNARRAVKAADRLNRIAAGAIAAIAAELQAHHECEAEGGKAHARDRNHRRRC